MKIVWHIKNLLKMIILVIVVGYIIGITAQYLNLNRDVAFLLGLIGGSTAVGFSLSRWEIYHFEDKK